MLLWQTIVTHGWAGCSKHFIETSKPIIIIIVNKQNPIVTTRHSEEF